MAMTRRQQRIVFIAGIVIAAAAAAYLVLTALKSNIVFFYSPSEIAAARPAEGARLRLGGLVETGSVSHDPDGALRFSVTDGAQSLGVLCPLACAGDVPKLFREAQGVIVEGAFVGGVFVAQRILAKHDERYMPPEVVDALKREGRWREGESAQ